MEILEVILNLTFLLKVWQYLAAFGAHAEKIVVLLQFTFMLKFI